jgi:hypothetical protein
MLPAKRRCCRCKEEICPQLDARQQAVMSTTRFATCGLGQPGCSDAFLKKIPSNCVFQLQQSTDSTANPPDYNLSRGQAA